MRIQDRSLLWTDLVYLIGQRIEQQSYTSKVAVEPAYSIEQ